MLQGVAQVLGLNDTTNPEALNEALQQKILEAQAKAQNISPEYLARLQTTEEKLAQYEQGEIQRNAYLGFQQVKTRFGLDDAQLQSFANELTADGQNPFEQPLDLVSTYISRNYDKLIEAAIQKGIQQEAERAAKATTHGTTPGQKTSGPSAGEAGKVASIKDLENWFNTQDKK